MHMQRLKFFPNILENISYNICIHGILEQGVCDERSHIEKPKYIQYT